MIKIYLKNGEILTVNGDTTMAFINESGTLIQLKRWKDETAEKYDYIFIDCPPVGIIADTQIIEEYADRTIFVARAGLFDRKDIASLQQAYDEKSMKNMCYIFNGVEPKSSYYGNYGRYGHYGNNNGYYYSKS